MQRGAVMAGRGRKRIKPIGVFESHVREINNQIREGILKNQSKAARLVVKELKKKVGDEYFEGYRSIAGEPPAKQSGRLQKGIGFAHDKHANDIETQVGFHRPAYHAHLMEFGTDTRYQTEVNGKPLSKPRHVGHVEPRPFFVNTLVENTGKIKEILSESVL
jgi:hypothetical protein